MESPKWFSVKEQLPSPLQDNSLDALSSGSVKKEKESTLVTSVWSPVDVRDAAMRTGHKMNAKDAKDFLRRNEQAFLEQLSERGNEILEGMLEHEYYINASLCGARKKYTVTIEETVSEDFEVIAESEEEARRLAERKYLAGEFVLDDCTVTDKQMRACANPEDDTDWHQF